MTKTLLTGDDVRLDETPLRSQLLESLRVGQPERWKPDVRTCDLWSLAKWLELKLTTESCPDDKRRSLLWFFNRKARAAEDLYGLAADCMNRFYTDTIETYRGR